MRRSAVTAPLILAVLAVLSGCGGSPVASPPAAPVSPAAPAPALAGLGRAIGAARQAVNQSQLDARRASGTTAGG